MAKKIKAGTVAVNLELDINQFSENFKVAQSEAKLKMSELSMELQRSKLKLKLDLSQIDTSKASGQLKSLRVQAEALQRALVIQKGRVTVSEQTLQGTVNAKGKDSYQAKSAERALMNEQSKLADLEIRSAQTIATRKSAIEAALQARKQANLDKLAATEKAAAEKVAVAREKIDRDLQRSKTKFALADADKSWADKLFSNTVIGKIRTARTETARLNEQIGFQKTKVEQARNSWTSILSIRGAADRKTIVTENAYLQEQAALAGLKTELNNTAGVATVLGGAMRSAALVGVAAIATLATAYANAARVALEWGQAVNDIADETGMADEEAARLLGTMRVVGLSTEDATVALAKMSRTVSEAAKSQDAAAKSGKESDDVFSRYGIAIRDADGALLSHSEILDNITSVHRSMRDGLAKTTMEMEIFGRSGYKLNDLLNMTSERSDEIAQKMAEMGLSAGLSSQKFEDMNQQLNMTKLALTSIANTATGDSIGNMTKELERLSTALAKWLREKERAENSGNKPSPRDDWGTGKALKDTYGQPKTNDVIPGDVTEDMVNTQNKNIDDVRKKNNEAVMSRLKQNETVLESTKELNRAIMDLNGKTLAVQLENIEVEKKKWEEKTKSQVAASQWAEAARAKAFRDAQDRIDAGLKAYQSAQDRVKSAYAGVGGAFQGAFGSAISEVMDAMRSGKGTNAAYYAVQKLRDEFELRKQATRAVAAEAGYSGYGDTFDPQSPWDAVNQAFENLEKAMADLGKAQLEYLKVIAQNTADIRNISGKGGNIKPDQIDVRTTLDATIPVSVETTIPVDLEATIPVYIDGQQVGQAAARILMPSVQAAVSQTKTFYGDRNGR